ncbi:isocitrate/isopropylmalate family dehydrogenase [Myxococcota bacterium]|nr:isocitrate/isopropylmalate family dehydrogenase [Myxococcota bacterium]
MSQIDVLYFPGDDRAEDASEVAKDVANAALARANEIVGSSHKFNWISENEDPRLTVGLRLWLRLKNQFDLPVLNENDARDKEVLNFILKSDITDIQAKYPKVQASDLAFIRDAAQSLLDMNVLVPSDGVLEALNRVGYSYKGATGTLSGKGTPASINVFIRQKLESDACVRDFKNVAPRKHKSVDVDMAVFVGCEGVTSESEHLVGTGYTDAKIITKKSAAVIQKAFEYAKAKGIDKVYVAEKGNILKESDNAFIDLAKAAEAETGVKMEYIIFDNFLQRITKNPDWFKVVVTSRFNGEEFLVPLAVAMFNEVEREDLGKDVGVFSRYVGKNIDYTKTKIDTRCYRQNNECFYIGEDKRTETESINFRRITRKMSENIIRYSLDDTLVRGAKRLFILYSPYLAGDKLFLQVGREIAREEKYKSIDVVFMTIGDYCWYTVHRPESVEGVVGTNLTMDFLTDAEASKIGGIGMMPSFNYTLETGIMVSEPGHGTAPDLQPNQINPGASIWAMAALLERMSDDLSGRITPDQKKTLAKAAELVYKATTQFYSAGQNLTGDLGGTGTTTGVGDGIKTILHSLQ